MKISYLFAFFDACLVKKNMRGYSNVKYLSISNIERGIEMKTICKILSDFPFISPFLLESLRLMTRAFFIEK